MRRRTEIVEFSESANRRSHQRFVPRPVSHWNQGKNKCRFFLRNGIKANIVCADKESGPVSRLKKEKNMKALHEMTQEEVLNHINTDLRACTLSFKSTIYLNWELNNIHDAAAREAGFKALAAREARHALACEVVGEWAVKNNRTGKAGRMSRKCRIDRLTRDCSTREEMEAAL